MAGIYDTIFTPLEGQKILDHVQRMNRTLSEIERAEAAGLSLGPLKTRCKECLAKLQSVHKTYFTPEM